jgi:hypothetical protein
MFRINLVTSVVESGGGQRREGSATRLYIHWPVAGQCSASQMDPAQRRMSAREALRQLCATSTYWARKTERMKNADLSWSRTAGCSCGCSPGFILRGVKSHLDLYVEMRNVVLPQVHTDEYFAVEIMCVGIASLGVPLPSLFDRKGAA